jgi:NAD(P)-dependent dehydrogenase (short-subunit alcohol dehydrogenase family)
MKYAIPQMLKQGAGVIVYMASILGVVGFATAGAYAAAKHGLIGLTQVAVLEYAIQGIRVNAVCPGFIETPMVMERGLAAGSHPEVYQQIAALHPMKRLGKPEEIAAAVVWLCSEAASFVTGHTLLVDGGYTAQ